MADEAYSAEKTECNQLIQDGRLVVATGDESQQLVVRELAAAFSRRAGIAARDASTQWDQLAEGKALLEETPTLWRHGPDTPDLAAREAETWVTGLEGILEENVASRSRRRRKMAALLATQVLGAPVASASGKWKSVLGDNDMRAGARKRLEAHVANVMAADAGRFLAITSRVNLPTGLAEMVRSMASQVSTRAGEFYQ